MGKQDSLGEFEQLTLLAVFRLGGEAYGAQIQSELEERIGREASVSSIYITLTRLEEKGFVSSRKGRPTGVRKGKPRRYFRLEPEGVTALHQARARFHAMWKGLPATPEGSGL